MFMTIYFLHVGVWWCMLNRTYYNTCYIMNIVQFFLLLLLFYLKNIYNIYNIMNIVQIGM